MMQQTIEAGVIWLDVGLLDSSVLDDKSVALGAVAAKDGSTVEGEVQCLGEAQAGVCQEADLRGA